MATIKGQQTLNEVLILEVAGDPSISGGTPAPTGSLALDDTGKHWRKFGALDTDWKDSSLGTSMAIYTEDVKVQLVIGTPADLNNLKEWLDHIWSVGLTAGAVLTDNGNGTVNISEGIALVRQMSSISITSSGLTATVTSPLHNLESGEYVYIEGAVQNAYNGDKLIIVTGPNTYTYQLLTTAASPATGTIYATGDHSQLIPSTIPAITNLAMVDHSMNYIYATKDGSPFYNVLNTPVVFGAASKALAYSVAREGNILYIIDGRLMNVDSMHKSKARALETETFKHVLVGTAIAETGTRNISVTEGAFYYGLMRVPHAAFNTAVSDTFTYCYRNGSGGYTYVPSATQISNTQYDNGTGTLATVSGSNYGVFWIYMMNNEPSSLLVQYGQSDYPNISSADAATVPTAPNIVLGVGALIGKITIRKNDAVFTSISSAFSNQFQPTLETNHEALAGLLGGSVNDHYHLTAIQATLATQNASTSQGGLLSSTDWNIFNGTSISITANYTAAGARTIFANSTGGAFTITLPPAASSLNVTYTIIKTDTSTSQVIVDANASELINGSLTMILDSPSGADFKCNGTSWYLS